MKQDFKAMSRKELREYILNYRDDVAYMDKLEASATWVEFPAPKSIDDLKNFPELLEKYRQQRQGEL